MATLHKLTKDGATIFPATITDAVVHPQTGKTLTSMMKDYNVSELFPTEGIDGGNKYNLALAIQVLGTHLSAAQKTGGIKLTFISSVTPYPEEEYYLSKSSWSGNASDWDQRFEVGDVVADPSGSWEPSTAQAYIDSQIAQVYTNLTDETIGRQLGDANLRTEMYALYRELIQTPPVVIEPTDTWPVSNPSTTVIYRVVDRTNTPPQYYSDYMWNGTTMVLMAQYNNAIVDTVALNNMNIVTSNGVAKKSDSYPFKCNYTAPFAPSIKNVKIYGFGVESISYVYLKYFFNSNRWTLTFAVVRKDGTEFNLEGAGPDMPREATNDIKRIRLVNMTTTTVDGYAIIDWSLWKSEYYGNYSGHQLVLSDECFTENRTEVVSSFGNSETSASSQSLVSGVAGLSSIMFDYKDYAVQPASIRNCIAAVKNISITSDGLLNGYIYLKYFLNQEEIGGGQKRNVLTFAYVDGNGNETNMDTSNIPAGLSNDIVKHTLFLNTKEVGYAVVDWSLTHGVSMYASTTQYCCKVRKDCFDCSEYLKSANDYSVKDNVEVTNVIFVDANGNGDYLTIAEACASIKKAGYQTQHEIVVNPGEYNEVNIIIPAYTHIHGTIPGSVIVTSKNYQDGPDYPIFDQRNASSKLSNMRIESYTGYCIHYDYNLGGHAIKNENLHLVNYVGGVIIGGGTFPYGTLFEWLNCVFESIGTPSYVACHTNVNANRLNTHLKFKYCKFVNCDLNLGSVGGYGLSVAEIEGCVFERGKRLGGWYSNLRNVTNMPYSYGANNIEWVVNGGNNKNMLVVLGNQTGEALQVISDSPVANQTITLSGSAVKDLFGIVKYQKGGTRIKASATGVYRVMDVQAGADGSDPVDVFQMWKRLGDCSEQNKNLTVEISGGIAMTYTFNKNYLTSKDSETSILSAINEILSGCTITKFSPSIWEIVNLKEKKLITCKESDGIIIGEWVDVYGNKCNASTAKEDVAGVAVSDALLDQAVQVWTGDTVQAAGYVDGNYGIGSDGQLEMNASVIIGKVRNQILYRV